jgi:hypothetical protein
VAARVPEHERLVGIGQAGGELQESGACVGIGLGAGVPQQGAGLRVSRYRIGTRRLKRSAPCASSLAGDVGADSAADISTSSRMRDDAGDTAATPRHSSSRHIQVKAAEVRGARPAPRTRARL